MPRELTLWVFAFVLFSGLSQADGDRPSTSPVEVGIFVIDISQVKELEQAVVVDFVVIARWQQPDLADAEAVGLRTFPLAAVDSPRLFVMNSRKLLKKLDDVVEVDPAGAVAYRQRYQGTLTVPMNLEDFPVDQQEVVFEVGSMEHAGRVLVKDEVRSGPMKPFTVAGWEVVDEGVRESRGIAPDGVTSLSLVTAQYRAKRNSLFFTWKLFIPLGLIVFMAYAVFWLDPTLIGTQIGVATSTVFTLIAYNFALSDILPRISYLTRADFFLVGCMFLVFGALGDPAPLPCPSHQ